MTRRLEIVVAPKVQLHFQLSFYWCAILTDACALTVCMTLSVWPRSGEEV